MVQVQMETVGERVKRLRRETGLTIRDLGEPGVTREYVSAIELGKRSPSWSALIKLAPKLGVSALYLATGQHEYCPVCERPESHVENEVGTEALTDLLRAKQIIDRAIEKMGGR